MERNQLASEDEEAMMASHVATASVLPMVLKSAIELGLLDIIAEVGPAGSLSAAEIAAQLPTTTSAAAATAAAKVDRILRFLAFNSLVKCSLAELPGGGGLERRYGVGRLTKFFTKNDGGVSFASICLMIQDKIHMESWYHLNDAILGDESPFEKAHGMTMYKYQETDPRFSKVFNESMHVSAVTIKKLLEIYKGFEGLNSIVDVGGCTGLVLSMIVAKYPSIKGINFDLPHVIKDAPSYPGVKHVSGDMFVSVPKGDAIFIKSVCHNWSDDYCLKLLRNCYEALPEKGKVIVVDYIIPKATLDTSPATSRVVRIDVVMLLNTSGGKERSAEEFEALAKAVGFKHFKVVCDILYCNVMEFLKD